MEHRSQRLAGMTFAASGDLFGRSYGHNLPALVARVGSEVYDPISGFYDFEVVLDDEDGVAGLHQSLEDFEQHPHVVKVEAGGRLVEQEQRWSRRGRALT